MNDTKTTPLSCGEAWIEASQHHSSHRKYDLADMQQSFDDGWKAALAAVRKVQGHDN